MSARNGDFRPVPGNEIGTLRDHSRPAGHTRLRWSRPTEVGMPPRRRAGDDPDDPLDDDFDTVRVRPSYDDEIFDEPIYTPGRGHVPTIIDAPFVETVDPPPVLPPLPPPMAPMTPPIPPTT